MIAGRKLNIFHPVFFSSQRKKTGIIVMTIITPMRSVSIGSAFTRSPRQKCNDGSTLALNLGTLLNDDSYYLVLLRASSAEEPFCNVVNERSETEPGRSGGLRPLTVRVHDLSHKEDCAGEPLPDQENEGAVYV